jgi:uncharacterized protein YdeI (YjbR/CyaY-like superfamily)
VLVAHIDDNCVATIEKRVLPLQTVSQEISQLKEKIKLYEADLEAAKKAGDKEDIKSKENLLISKENLLTELQKEKNLLIAINGVKIRCIYSLVIFSLFLNLLFLNLNS